MVMVADGPARGAAGRPVSAGRLRALSFTRHAPGAADTTTQRKTFASACAARGWYTAGGAVRQYGGGFRPWAAAIVLVRRGLYDVVVVDALERIADTDDELMAVLAMLRRAGVRLLAVREGLDTGDPAGWGLVDSLLAGHGVRVAGASGWGR
jgi:hypothetical protein